MPKVCRCFAWLLTRPKLVAGPAKASARGGGERSGVCAHRPGAPLGVHSRRHRPVTSVAPRTLLEPTSAMSTSSREPISSPVPEKAGVWEDFIDIFYAPSSVFARRANASVWPPLLVVTLLVG